MKHFFPISTGAIKIPLPNVEQNKSYSCGPSALKSVCLYFGVGLNTEKDYIKALESNHGGTIPDNIIWLARQKKLRVESRHNMTLNDLRNLLDQEKPIIISLQAWGKEKYYKEKKCGHYVAVIGYDNNSFYFQDSMLTGCRGILSNDELDNRWYDKDKFGNNYDHFGMIIWKDSSNCYLNRAKRIK